MLQLKPTKADPVFPQVMVMAITLLVVLVWPPGWEEEEEEEKGLGQFPSLAGGAGAKQLSGAHSIVLQWGPGDKTV